MSNEINDRFSNAPTTRHYKWSLRQRAKGNCVRCGTKRPKDPVLAKLAGWTVSLCPACAKYKREWGRRKNKLKGRGYTGSKYDSL